MVNEMQTHAETTGADAPEPPDAAQPRTLSAGQVRAIFDAMRTFRDDDMGRAGRTGAFTCHRCGRVRASAGAVSYGDVRLCNGCATDYELLHTAGIERDLLAPPGPAAAAD
jgi:hypothetical protein